MRIVSFHRQARQDLLQAAEYYDQQLAGLGRQFLDEVHRNLELIAASPGMGRVTVEGTRTWLLRKFPYSIVYGFQMTVSLWLRSAIIDKMLIIGWTGCDVRVDAHVAEAVQYRSLDRKLRG